MFVKNHFREHKPCVILCTLSHCSHKSLGYSQMVQRQEWIWFYQQVSGNSPLLKVLIAICVWLFISNPIIVLFAHHAHRMISLSDIVAN